MGGITHLPKRFVLIAWLIGLCMMVNVLSRDSVAQELRPARLYFIRHSTFVGIINSPDVSVDGRLIGSIATGSYLVVERPPGRHTISLSHWADFGRQFVADVEVSPGSSSYFEIAIAIRGSGGIALPSLAGEVGKPMRAWIDTGPTDSTSWMRQRVLKV